MRLLSAIGFLLMVLVAAEVRADITTINNPPYSIAYGTPSQIVTNSPSQSIEAASAFSLPTASFLNSLTWYGYYSSPQNLSGGGTDFLIRIFQDNGGVPGTLLDSYNVNPTPVNFTNTLGWYQYSVTWANPANGPPQSGWIPGGNLWLSILETDPSTSAPWNWVYSINNGGSCAEVEWRYRELGFASEYPATCV